MSTTLEKTVRPGQIGLPVDRVDGRVKVTGEARYSSDTPVERVLHAVVVQATIARGRIAAFEESAARALAGVVEVMTYRNAPHVVPLPFDAMTAPAIESFAPLQNDAIAYDGQHVAVVLAETFEAARAGAALLQVRYEAEPWTTQLADALEIERPASWFGHDLQARRGDPEGAYATAAVRVDATYTTPIEHHNPLEPSATLAWWEGGDLVVHDTTQWVLGTRACLAAAFELDEARVRVIAPFIGGGFGCKGFFWAHALLAAMAAKLTARPVKLVLTREQMFTSVGYRTQTEQRLRLGAAADGRLQSTLHDVLSTGSRVGEFLESAGGVSAMLFECPNLAVTHRVAKLDIPTPTAMRAPGEAPGSFALGSAMDELAYAGGLDPLEVLRRNHSDHDDAGLPYSSKHLLECYDRGAERFGWARRPLAPRSLREGDELIGWGVATATYPALRMDAAARVTIGADGNIDVASATHDLGTGQYTILAQIAAEALGVEPHAIRVRLGDSAFPRAPVAGGSMSAASVGPAVLDGARRAYREAVTLAIRSGASPLYGMAPEAIEPVDGVLRAKDDPTRAIAYADVVRLSSTGAIETLGSAAPGNEGQRLSFHSFGAHFCEVRYDEEIARLRVTRVVSVIDAGRVLNAKTARSQILGGVVWGIGMALLEETIRDPRAGAVVTDNLADYHIAVNADIPEIDVLFVEEPDLAFNPLGARGIGEIGITGVAAALANAVYHATGVRVRDLPIVPEKLLLGTPA